MPDRLRSIIAKIERAEEHIRNLETALRAFLAKNPYRPVAYNESDTGDRVIKLTIVEIAPISFSLILGDAIHNLRSALDHLAQQLVLANNGTPTEQTCFPIFHRADCKAFEAGFERAVQGASKQALDLIRTLKPYQGGNEALCGLHRLDILDKHRLLVAVAATNPATIIRLGVVPLQAFPIDAEGRRVSNLIGPLEDGVELWRMLPKDRPQFYHDPEFRFDVAFGDVFKGQPMLPTLHQLLKLVRGIVESFNFLLS